MVGHDLLSVTGVFFLFATIPTAKLVQTCTCVFVGMTSVLGGGAYFRVTLFPKPIYLAASLLAVFRIFYETMPIVKSVFLEMPAMPFAMLCN